MANAIQVGSKAPNFTSTAQDGRIVSLHDYAGKKVVVLYFYPKDETSVCTAEACAFRDQYQVFRDAGAEVIGVSSDSAESHQKFAAHHRLPFLLLSDGKKQLRKLYGVPSTFGVIPGRVTYVIDKQGVVRQLFSSQLNGEKHVSEALKTIRTLK